MENFEFILFSIVILLLLGGTGYWAFSTMESGSTHVFNQTKKKLEQENKALVDEISILKNEISLLKTEKEETPTIKEEPIAPVQKVETKTEPQVKTTVLKYQSLINELQKLVDGNIYLKNKSQGVAVGTIQKFLNIYNNTSNRVDNDYGVSTVTAVKNFQKAQGLTVDGGTGPSTYKKMIIWLKTK